MRGSSSLKVPILPLCWGEGSVSSSAEQPGHLCSLGPSSVGLGLLSCVLPTTKAGTLAFVHLVPSSEGGAWWGGCERDSPCIPGATMMDWRSEAALEQLRS